MNCYERFARRARTRPDEPAILDPDGSDLTYGELAAQAATVANWLVDRTEPGDRVAVLMLDNPTVIAVALGAWRAGRVFTPVNYRFGRDEVAYVLDDVDPAAVVHDAVFATTATEAVEQAGLEIPVVPSRRHTRTRSGTTPTSHRPTTPATPSTPAWRSGPLPTNGPQTTASSRRAGTRATGAP